MIEKAIIQQLAEEALEGNMFLVDVTVNERNVIHVFVDAMDGLSIEKCVKISRHIEHCLDRDDEDFELQVSSPGLTEGFKVLKQYEKYKDKEIEVKTATGEKFVGKLTALDKDGIELETSSRKKVEGHKKKQLVVKKHQLLFAEIEQAKAVISFK
ncbi:MAG: ribosome assembly cofactor RimP [Draconibacterium sp.]|nr:MAG: ribosome assembly cofactor RimP [Draconibacterium sp.]